MLRRVFRILRTSLTILSLILFLATIGLWVRSYRVYDSCWRTSGEFTTLALFTWPGRITVAWGHMSGSSRNYVDGWYHVSEEQWIRESPMFRLDHPVKQYRPTHFYAWRAMFPTWLPAILFAILPALKLRAILRARKQTRGFEVVLATDDTDKHGSKTSV